MIRAVTVTLDIRPLNLAASGDDHVAPTLPLTLNALTLNALTLNVGA